MNIVKMTILKARKVFQKMMQENGFENAVNAAVEAAYNKDCKMREKK